jgi:spermidine synthase
VTRPWLTVAAEATPDGLLELKQRERDYLITLDGRVVMTSAAHRSEDALAELACAGLRERAGARVFVSGLGMGYTLRAALEALQPDARVVVAELNPIVARWCEGPLAALTGGAASDPRVTLELVDAVKRLGRPAARGEFDAIVLDLYEGPRTAVAPGHALYGRAAAAGFRAALRPDGVLAVWCEARSPGFERWLEAAGLRHDLQRVGRGARHHFVYLARPAPSGARAAAPAPRPRAQKPAQKGRGRV